MELAVATYNVGPGQLLGDLNKLKYEADVLLLQETGDRQEQLSRFLTNNKDWQGYRGNDRIRGSRHVTILSKRDLHRIKTFTRITNPPTWVGNPGAGPPLVEQKVVNRIVCVPPELGGTRVHLMSTHYTASIERNSLPNDEARDKHAKRQTRVLRDVIDRRKVGFCIFGGDFNMEADNNILHPIRAVAVNTSNLPTHGPRAIDLIWYKKTNKPLVVTKRETLDLTSDHRAKIVTFRLG